MSGEGADCENKKYPGPAQESTLARISRHRKALDDSLASMPEGTPERDRARAYVVGQIDGIDWALKTYSV